MLFDEHLGITDLSDGKVHNCQLFISRMAMGKGNDNQIYLCAFPLAN